MATPYLGQISIFAYGIVPPNFTPCNGQVLQIAQNGPLFAVLGTTFGGDGARTFALPDLRSRVILGQPQGNAGVHAGEESVMLTAAQMPSHTHAVAASSEPTTLRNAAVGNYPAAPAAPSAAGYATSWDTALGTGSTVAGASAAHTNLPPYLALNICIATSGFMPPRP